MTRKPVTVETIETQVRHTHLEAELAATASGAAIGALAGAMAGPPGVLAGAVIGTLVGAAAGVALDDTEREREVHDATIERIESDADEEMVARRELEKVTGKPAPER